MNQRSATTSMGRRAFLAGATGAAAAGTVPAGVTAQEDPFDGYLDDARNYDGSITDATGQDEVQVAVGAGDGISFDPAAIRIDPGATVVWEWTGEGGDHDVTARDESFQSELTGEEGATFERTFEEAGVASYYCTPHRASGMKGGIVVGDPDVGSDGGGLQSIPLLPGVGIALVIIAVTSAAVGRWVGGSRDESRT